MMEWGKWDRLGRNFPSFHGLESMKVLEPDAIHSDEEYAPIVLAYYDLSVLSARMRPVISEIMERKTFSSILKEKWQEIRRMDEVDIIFYAYLVFAGYSHHFERER